MHGSERDEYSAPNFILSRIKIGTVKPQRLCIWTHSTQPMNGWKLTDHHQQLCTTHDNSGCRNGSQTEIAFGHFCITPNKGSAKTGGRAYVSPLSENPDMASAYCRRPTVALTVRFHEPRDQSQCQIACLLELMNDMTSGAMIRE